MEITQAQQIAEEVRGRVQTKELEPQTPARKIRGEDWVQFKGHIRSKNNKEVIVEADDGTDSIIALDLTDVQALGNTVLLRVGALARFWRRPGSKAQPPSADVCRGMGSMCTGSVQFCCDNGETLGKCSGSWTCP